MKRSEEVRRLLAIPAEELEREAKGQLRITRTLDELYEFLAEEMTAEFRKAAAGNRVVSFIMPVGPTQPYRIMAQKINAENLSLKNVRFFFMDEYCTDDGNLIPKEHPLSFRGQIGGLFFDHVRPALLMPPEQIIFPAPENLKRLPAMIEEAGGIEVCYGGIGIHGHVAFNEPEPGVAETDPRILTINDFTRTIDATRHPGAGGNLENFPRRAITLGMKQCLGARRALLMTRNESPALNWANTIVRIAALGEPGDDYPVTHFRNHPNCLVATDANTAAAPKFNL
ncbi:MAG: glucosamine-6-phosphate isomerase [Lentisphaeria bacterium]|nr:glucosamine-6-phosphate isomerase [Lentisphaeria bacterium]